MHGRAVLGRLRTISFVRPGMRGSCASSCDVDLDGRSGLGSLKIYKFVYSPVESANTQICIFAYFIYIQICIFLEEYLEWGGQVNATTRRIKMTAFSSDTCGENTSSKQLKEVARIQLDEEGAACHLFGYTCSTLCRKWRATGLEPMEERDRNILEHVRNKKKQDAWIRSRYRQFIYDRRWTNH